MWKNVDRLPVIVGLVAVVVSGAGVAAQQGAAPRGQAGQKIDAEYTAKIKEYLQDPRITTELVDHLPASDTVPTPLKFLGRIVGQPGELTYAKDIHRYYEALAQGLAARALLDHRQDRRRPRHGGAGDRRRGDHQARSRSTAISSPRSPTRARPPRRRRRRCSRPPSRSTTSPAACTRPRTAAPRC